MRISENRLDEILEYWRSEPDQDVELLPTPHENAFLALDLRDARNQIKIAKAALERIAEIDDNEGGQRLASIMCDQMGGVAREALEQLK